jgi:hypothetical protein
MFSSFGDKISGRTWLSIVRSSNALNVDVFWKFDVEKKHIKKKKEWKTQDHHPLAFQLGLVTQGLISVPTKQELCWKNESEILTNCKREKNEDMSAYVLS